MAPFSVTQPVLPLTTTLHVAVRPFEVVAVITASPLATAVTFPDWFTLATLALLDVQVTVVSWVVLLGSRVAFNTFVSSWPTVKLISVSFKLILVIGVGSFSHCAYRTKSLSKFSTCSSVYVVPLPSAFVFHSLNLYPSLTKVFGFKVNSSLFSTSWAYVAVLFSSE